MKYKIFVFIACISLAGCIEYKIDVPDDWIDPSDMTGFHYETMKGSQGVKNGDDSSPPKETVKDGDKGPSITKETPPTNEQKKKDQESKEGAQSKIDKSQTKNERKTSDFAMPGEACENPYLRRFVSVLHRKLGYVGQPPDIKVYELRVHLDHHQWSILNSFSEECGSNVAEVTDILESILSDVRIALPPKKVSLKERFEDYIPFPFEDVMKMGTVFLLILAALTMEIFSRISWSTQLRRLLVVAFVLTFPLTYIHELKMAEAEYKSKAIDIPDECKHGKELSYVGSAKAIWNSYFSVSKDPCTEYHASHLISPHIKVTPTKVLMVTFTRFAVEPLEHVGTAFSKAFQNIFAGLPVTLWIPAFLFVILIILGFLLIIAVCFGYNFSFNLPFWAGLQMGPQQTVQANPHLEQQLADNRQHIEYLHETIRELRGRSAQQALPAPPSNETSSPRRALRAIMGYMGYGDNSTTPTSLPPPYPEDAQQDFPPQCPYPDFGSPSGGQRTRSTSEVVGGGYYEPPQSAGGGIRRRHTVAGFRQPPPPPPDGAGDYSYARPPPLSEYSPQRRRNDPIPAMSGRNPVGFEHLLFENVENTEEEDEQDVKVSSSTRQRILEARGDDMNAEKTETKSPKKGQEKKSNSSDLKGKNCIELEGRGDGNEGNPKKDRKEEHYPPEKEIERQETPPSVEYGPEDSETVPFKTYSKTEVETIPFDEETKKDDVSGEDWEELSFPAPSCDHGKTDCPCEKLSPEELMNYFQEEAQKGISLAPSEE